MAEDWLLLAQQTISASSSIIFRVGFILFSDSSVLHFHNSHHLHGMCLPAQVLSQLSLMDKICLPFNICSDPFSIEEETEAQGESRLPRWQGLALRFVFLTSGPPGCGNTDVCRCKVVLLPGGYDCLPGHMCVENQYLHQSRM